MNQYATSVDLRKALEARLKRQAEQSGTDLMRLRRIVVFDRIAARLSACGGWVLKGGTSLEFRLGLRARATKDLDLALRDGPSSSSAMRDELIENLANDADQDGFTFTIGLGTPLEPDAAGNPGWRFSVTATLGGKTFAQVRMDIVARSEELAATEQIALPGSLTFAGIPPRTIECVNRRQHFAEKLHALTRDYGIRPNTRVKDLVDLILLIDHLPPAWTASYPKLAAESGLAETGFSAALETLRRFWAHTIDMSRTGRPPGIGRARRHR